MRLMRYRFTISHLPGKELTVADTLSRAPALSASSDDVEFHQYTEMYVNLIMENLPVTEQRLAELKQQQDNDETCQQLKYFCQSGWPPKHQVKGKLKAYTPFTAELTIQKGLLMRNRRIVIPSLVQRDILDKLHCGHQGITKCRLRAQQSVWWPGLSKQLEELVTGCPTCSKERSQHAEPLTPTQFPKLPWQKVASDLFTIKGVNYLLVIDYFSRYIEVAKLTQETSNAIITHLKSIFARHGIPQVVVTDNGPQYSSREFFQFAKEYCFEHQTSSPHFPQSNGEAERGVQTVKKLLKMSDDPYLALLSYRTTPLPNNGYSPSELLMNRKLRDNLPTTENELRPKIPDYS